MKTLRCFSVIFVLLAFAAVAAAADSPLLAEVKRKFGQPLPPKLEVVQDNKGNPFVKDGDTIVVKDANGDEINVRFLGVDAPEVENKKKKQVAQPFSQEAKDFVEDIIKESGNEITFIQEAFQQKDNNGRSVGWVIVDVGNGDELLQELLLEEGLTKIVPKYLPLPFYLSEMLKGENKAQILKKNLWEDYPCEKGKTVWITPTGKTYHTQKCHHANKSGLKGFPLEIPLEQAEVHGLTPCKQCKP
jgi:endonuclease YncB( thermonuclease family)